MPDGAGTCTTPLALADPMLWTLTDPSLDPFAERFDAGVERCVGDAGGPSDGPDDGATDGSGDGAACTGPVRCGADEARFEWFGSDPSLQIDTRFCNWATVEQPALADVEAGEGRGIRVWYFAQTPPEPTLAVAAVAFGGEVVWQDEIELPVSRGSLLYDLSTWPASIGKGATISFHLHNHGDNSWNLLELSVVRTVPCPHE
jgi:hypothetical protein